MATTFEQLQPYFELKPTDDTKGKVNLSFIYGQLLNLNNSSYSSKNVEKYNRLVFTLPTYYGAQFGLTQYFKLSNGYTVEVALQGLREDAQLFLEGLRANRFECPEKLYAVRVTSPKFKESVTLIRDNLVAEIIRFPPLNDSLPIFVDVTNPDKEAEYILQKYDLSLANCLKLDREHGFFL